VSPLKLDDFAKEAQDRSRTNSCAPDDVEARPSAGLVVELPIDHLKKGPVLRVMGEDQAHIRLLAWTPTPLPPILVDQATMIVIDGMHRVMAAQLRGDRTIPARFFQGRDDERFVAALRANIEHGKPLTLADREHAAERLIAIRPDWSNRIISETCALAPKTVANIRKRASIDVPQLNTRTGRDGRVRPVDPNLGRERAVTALVAQPDASLRQIAEKSGISVATAGDVRRRLQLGENPLRAGRARREVSSARPDGGVSEPQEPGDRWGADASMVSTEATRVFAQWMDTVCISPEDCDRFVDVLPLSRLYAIVQDAEKQSKTWAMFAVRLEDRVRTEAARPKH
jgi:ParB-like chromosome segregation protein Spo0J